jgi:hypothetical protein
MKDSTVTYSHIFAIFVVAPNAAEILVGVNGATCTRQQHGLAPVRLVLLYVKVIIFHISNTTSAFSSNTK